jgi:hypothetical protein
MDSLHREGHKLHVIHYTISDISLRYVPVRHHCQGMKHAFSHTSTCQSKLKIWHGIYGSDPNRRSRLSGCHSCFVFCTSRHLISSRRPDILTLIVRGSLQFLQPNFGIMPLTGILPSTYLLNIHCHEDGCLLGCCVV